MWALAEAFPAALFPAMAIHPSDIEADFAHQLDTVRHELATRPYVAVGETGIDLYWDKSLVEQQTEAFREHIRLALQHNLPLIVHVRESFDEVFQVLEQMHQPGLRGVFHCFTGDAAQARRAIALGFRLGIGGVLTYKKSALPEVMQQVDVQHIVLETDAPYLAPVPKRGTRNESSYLPYIGQFLATVKGLSAQYVAQATTENAQQLFGI